jgi:hypothetical protein
MPEDAPVAVEVSAAPPATQTQPEPAAPTKPRVFTLDDVPKSTTAVQPKPIALTWPVVHEDGTEEEFVLPVDLQYPKNPDGSPMDLWAFQLNYMGLAEESRTPKLEADGTQSYPNAGCHDRFLREMVIVEPAFLRDEKDFVAFSARVPPYVVTHLNQELRLAVGLSADFFGRLFRYVNPEAYSQSLAASASASGASRTRSSPVQKTTS